MSAFERTVSKIDLLGIPIILNLSKANKVKSGFGGCWTLAFLAFVLWALWTNGCELWQKKKPTVNEGVVYDRKPRPLSFDAGTLPMMIHIEISNENDGVTNAVDEAALANAVVCNFQYLLQTNIKDNGINGTWMDMEPCTKDHFANFMKDGGIIDDDTEEIITYSYCLPMTKTYGMVYGFSISVDCPDQTGIDEFIDEDPTIEIYYPKYGMSLQNYTYPLQPYLYNYETSMKAATTTRSYWDINYLNITTDHGWLATDYQTENFVQVAPALNPEVLLKGDNQNVFVFRISQEEFFYTRIYTKVQNVLAAVGGLAGSVLAILLIVITPFARMKLSEAFVNEMFEKKNSKGPNSPDDAKSIGKNNMQANEMSPLTQGNGHLEIEMQQDTVRDPNEIKIEDKNGKTKGKPQKTKSTKPQKVVDIGFCEYLSSFIFKSQATKAKIKIIQDGLNMLDSRLDVFNLMKKMRDIDKVKGLFLNKEQSYLFERLSRPDVTDRESHWYQEDYVSYSEVFKSGNQVEEVKVQSQMKENQKIIQNKSQKNEVDQRILELL